MSASHVFLFGFPYVRFLGCGLFSCHNVVYASDCGPEELIATDTTQEIRSPRFPRPYPASSSCSWTIRPRGSRENEYSSYVKLVLDIVKMNDSEDCRHEFIQVLLSNTDDEGVKICSSGYSPHSFLLSAENNPLRVNFQSGYQDSNSSFRLLYIEEKVESSIFWTERSGNQSKIQRLSLNYDGIPEDYSIEEVLGNDGTRFQGIASDYKQKMVCWTDQVTSRGFGCTDTGRNHTVSVGMGWETSSQSEGLAIDWISKNFYLVDGFYNSIKIGNFDFSNEVVFTLIERGLSRPRAVAVNPLKRFIFWTDVGAVPKIERSNLAGEHRRVIVSSGLTSPNGITVDVGGQKIYWTDAGGDFSSMESANLDGTYRRILFKRPASEASFFDVTLFKNLIFVTDTGANAVRVFKKSKPHQQLHSLSTAGEPYGITTDDPWAQPTQRGQNPCLKNPCSHICVGYNSEQKYKCVCPNGFAVAEDGHTCTLKYVPKSSLIMSTMSKICFLPPTFPHERFLPLAPSDLCFIDDVHLITSIAADVDDNLLFYFNASSKTINSLSLSSEKNGIVVVELTQFAEAIAVDWIFNNLYWVDSEVGALFVTDYEGNHQVLLHSGIGVPKDVVVDSVERLVFWCGVHDYPYIERSHLDGNFRQTLVIDDLQLPGGMVLHLLERKLYFSDKKRGTIESINYDGTDRQVVYTNPKGAEFYKMAIYQDYLVWTEVDLGFLVLNLKTKTLVRSVVTLDITLGLVMYSEAVQPFREDSCTLDSATCDQIVLPSNTESGWICKCSFGYKLATDGVTCISEYVNDTTPFLLVSDASWKGVFQVNLDAPRFGPSAVVDLKKKHRGPSVVAFDPVESMVYYALAGRRNIYRKNLGDDGQEELIMSGAQGITSLVIDPNQRMYFWSSSKEISTAFLGGCYIKTIISGRKGITSIAIHPEEGKLYWLESGETPSLWSATMNGANLEKMNPEMKAGSYPVGLTIDYESAQLFWSDPTKHTIETLSLDDPSDHQILLQLNETSEPVDLFISEGYVYWLDWGHRSVLKANKASGDDITIILQNLASPTALFVQNVNDSIPEHGGCSDNNGGCDVFCLPSGAESKECSCSDKLECQDILSQPPSPLEDMPWPGGNFEMLCALPNAVVTWYRNGVDITDGDDPDIFIDKDLGRLFILDAREEHAGCYKCEMTLPCHRDVSFVKERTLYFSDEDYFCKKPKNASLDLHDTHVMDCAVQRKDFTYRWEKNGEELQFTNNFEQVNDTAVRINRMGSDDEGEYTCIAIPDSDEAPKQVSTFLEVKNIQPPACGLASGPSVPIEDAVRNADDTSNPWVARLYTNNGRKLVCIGTLITNNWVITAAHCLKENNISTADQIKIKIGTHEAAPVLNVAEIVIHGNCSKISRYYTHNLVLLKLNPGLTVTPYTKPICLPDNNLLSGSENLRGVRGKIVFIKHGRTKQAAEKFMTVSANRQCRGVAVVEQSMRNKLFCAAYHKARNCDQNQGAGFVVQSDQRWYLLGVMGYRQCQTNGQGYIYYTKLYPYMGWINSVTQ